MAKDRGAHASKCIDVETTTLSDIVKAFSSVKLIKIDTEGHDLHVLRGAKNMLANTQYVIVEQNTTDVIDFLLRSGFDHCKFTPSQYLLAFKKNR